MTAINDDIVEEGRRSASSAPAGNWFAFIATAPADLSEKVYVTIPDFDPALRFGPCRWQARSDTALPDRGDRALVQRDNRGEWWVVAWWPFGD